MDARLRVQPVPSASRKLLSTTASMPPLYTMPLSGCPLTTYSVPVTIGSQKVNASIDTGSTTFAAASTTCTQCGVSPGYALDKSADNLAVAVSSKYGIGAWQGVEVQDVVQLGDGPATPLVFADILQQQDFFKPNDCVYGSQLPSSSQAIMGMGPVDLLEGTTQSYIASVLPHLRYPAFALTVCESGGALYLGGYPSASVNATPFYTPTVASSASPYLAVGMLGLAVGGHDTGARLADFDYTLVDTGSSGLILPTDVYETVVDEVSTATQGLLGTSFFAGDYCLHLSPGVSANAVNAAAPSLTFSFYNPSGVPFAYTVPATHAYLSLRKDPSGQAYLCSLLIDAAGKLPTIMGITTMQNSTVIFDLENGQVGFAPSAGVC